MEEHQGGPHLSTLARIFTLSFILGVKILILEGRTVDSSIIQVSCQESMKTKCSNSQIISFGIQNRTSLYNIGGESFPCIRSQIGPQCLTYFTEEVPKTETVYEIAGTK